MNLESYYELFIYITNLDIDIKNIFFLLDENIKKEIFDYIDFLKTKPSKKNFLSYKISKEALENFIEAVESIIKKVFKK